MNAKFWIFFFSFLQITFCGFAKELDYCRLIDKMNKQFTEDIHKKYGFKGAGSGGAFMEGIGNLSLDFDCDKEYSIEEIRVIMVDLFDKYIQTVNCNQQIRPYLNHYPFEKVIITLCCNDKNDHLSVDEPSIAMALISEKHVHYYVCPRLPNGHKSALTSYKKLYTETLDQAKGLAGNEKRTEFRAVTVVSQSN